MVSFFFSVSVSLFRFCFCFLVNFSLKKRNLEHRSPPKKTLAFYSKIFVFNVHFIPTFPPTFTFLSPIFYSIFFLFYIFSFTLLFFFSSRFHLLIISLSSLSSFAAFVSLVLLWFAFDCLWHMLCLYLLICDYFFIFLYLLYLLYVFYVFWYFVVKTLDMLFCIKSKPFVVCHVLQ